MKNKSPIRYPGGKTRACKTLDAILTSHFDMRNIDTVISPFFGGGSFEFHLQNKYNVSIVANDKFKPLYSFWDRSKYENPELCSKLYAALRDPGGRGAPEHMADATTSKIRFEELKKGIMDEKRGLNQAVSYFIINRCSFSGATLSGGFSKEAAKNRFTKSSVDRIQSLSLSNFTISNEDFSEFINRVCAPGSRRSLLPKRISFYFWIRPTISKKNPRCMDATAICMKVLIMSSCLNVSPLPKRTSSRGS